MRGTNATQPSQPMSGEGNETISKAAEKNVRPPRKKRELRTPRTLMQGEPFE
jgi:hypothetical protein